MNPQEVLTEIRRLGRDVVLEDGALIVQQNGFTSEEDMKVIAPLEQLVVEHKAAIFHILLTEKVGNCLLGVLRNDFLKVRGFAFTAHNTHCDLILLTKPDSVRFIWSSRAKIEEFVGEITGLPVQFSCKEGEPCKI